MSVHLPTHHFLAVAGHADGQTGGLQIPKMDCGQRARPSMVAFQLLNPRENLRDLLYRSLREAVRPTGAKEQRAALIHSVQTAIKDSLFIEIFGCLFQEIFHGCLSPDPAQVCGCAYNPRLPCLHFEQSLEPPRMQEKTAARGAAMGGPSTRVRAARCWPLSVARAGA